MIMDKLLAVTNQLLDLGKRNRLLNYKDHGLKTLAILNKNTKAKILINFHFPVYL